MGWLNLYKWPEQKNGRYNPYNFVFWINRFHRCLISPRNKWSYWPPGPWIERTKIFNHDLVPQIPSMGLVCLPLLTIIYLHLHLAHRIHVWNIYLHLVDVLVNVGQYTSPVTHPRIEWVLILNMIFICWAYRDEHPRAERILFFFP